MNDFTIGFIGLGLIGGSIAKSLKASLLSCTLVAYDSPTGPSRKDLCAAKQEGFLDTIYDEFEACYRECDVIFLCAPVLVNVHYMEKLKNVIKKDCIVTDVSSVKCCIHEAAEMANLSGQFIGGHPMAGSEKTGFINARDNLLENAYYILTPTKDTKEQDLRRLIAIIEIIGAIPIILDAKEHDTITASISHVPHLIAAQLVNLVRNAPASDKMKLLAAGGFRDITRIASSSPIMWEDICLTNTECIKEALTDYIHSLEDVIRALDCNNGEYIYSIFDTAGTYRDDLPKRSQSIVPPLYEIYLDILDEAGAIATIATILATNQLSLKNIGIIHNREFQEGVLRIEFYDDVTLEKAVSILKRHHYSIYER